MFPLLDLVLEAQSCHSTVKVSLYTQITTDAAQILFTFIFAFSVLTENSNTLSRGV